MIHISFIQQSHNYIRWKAIDTLQKFRWSNPTWENKWCKKLVLKLFFFYFQIFNFLVIMKERKIENGTKYRKKFKRDNKIFLWFSCPNSSLFHCYLKNKQRQNKKLIWIFEYQGAKITNSAGQLRQKTCFVK